MPPRHVAGTSAAAGGGGGSKQGAGGVAGGGAAAAGPCTTGAVPRGRQGRRHSVQVICP